MEKFVYRKEGLKLTKPDEIVAEQREDIKALKNQISDLEKTLELACAKLLSIYCSDYCGETSNCEKINCEYAKRSGPDFFKTKAKEMMRSE